MISRYLLAIVITGIGILTQEMLREQVSGLSFFFLYPAVFFTSALAGFGPGLLATALSALAAVYFFIEPYYAFQINNFDTKFRFLGFIILGALVSYLNEKIRRYREAQIASASEFHAMFSLAATGMTQIDPRTNRFVQVNQKLCEITGYSREELLKKTFLDITHPEDRDADLEKAKKFAQGLMPFYVAEKRYIRKDGSVVWISANVTLIKDTAGKPVRTVGVIQDITDRKQAEKEKELLLAREKIAHAMAESERKKLYNLFMQAPAFISINRGPHHIYEFSNLRNNEVLGRSDVIGKPVNEILGNPETIKSVRPILDSVLQTGKSVILNEYPMVRDWRKNGTQETRILSAVVQPLMDIDGKVEGIMTFAIDVTAQVSARKQIEEQRKWLENLLDLLPTPVILLRSGSTVTEFANKAADQSIEGGFPRNLPLEEYHHLFSCTDESGKKLSLDELPISRAAQGEKLDRVILNIHGPSDVKSFSISSDILPAGHGHEPTVVIGFSDISQQKRIEQQLKSAVQAREEFLSIASHELKTPITSLKLQLQMSMRGLKQPQDTQSPHERLKKSLDVSLEQVNRLTNLVEELLDVSRIGAGKMTLHYERTDLSQLAREVADRLCEHLNASNCKIEVQLQGEVHAQCDRFRMEQVITNLLTNSAKYAAGKPVTLKVEKQASTARIIVQDFGMGIARDKQERIFDRFERAISSNNISGLGLGLYIAREILKAHQGSITVESEENAGSVFTVELPLE